MANDGNQSKRIKLYSLFVVGFVSIFHVRDTRCNHWHVPGINSIITAALIHFQFENCYAMTFSFVFVDSPKCNNNNNLYIWQKCICQLVFITLLNLTYLLSLFIRYAVDRLLRPFQHVINTIDNTEWAAKLLLCA